MIGPAKECTGCGEVKPLAEFVRNRGRPDGHGERCLACHREAKADYDAGVRWSTMRTDANRTGRFLCVCAVAYPAPKLCSRCGWPVVAAMHPDVQARALAKHPWFAQQPAVSA